MTATPPHPSVPLFPLGPLRPALTLCPEWSFLEEGVSRGACLAVKSGQMILVFISGSLSMGNTSWHNRKEVTVILSVQLISQGEIKKSVYGYSAWASGESDSHSSQVLPLSEKVCTHSVKKAKDRPKTQRSHSGVYIQKNTKQDLEEISAPMFTAALFTLVKNRSNPGVPQRMNG